LEKVLEKLVTNVKLAFSNVLSIKILAIKIEVNNDVTKYKAVETYISFNME
jgi:flagellar motor switch protein FliM